MTPQQIEALKMAIEALKMADELCRGHGVDFKEYGLEFDRDIQIKYKDAITALKEALAQPERLAELGWQEIDCPICGGGARAFPKPEQEPVAYFHPHKGFYWAKPTSISAPTIAHVEPLPLYTAPPQRTEQNFCIRCGKRTKDIHTCTPPKVTT